MLFDSGNEGNERKEMSDLHLHNHHVGEKNDYMSREIEASDCCSLKEMIFAKSQKMKAFDRTLITQTIELHQDLMMRDVKIMQPSV